jgi:hypothetical protein
MTPPPSSTGSTPGFGRGGLGKHTRLKTYPANPATGVEGGENPLPDGENPCRVGYPAPTRQNPATGVEGGARIPSLTGKTPAGLGTRHPPFCRVVSGGCRGIHPTRLFAIGKGVNLTLRRACRVCRVGFQGGVLPPPLARQVPGEVPGTGFADGDGHKPPFKGRVCRVLPGACRVVYPARILPMVMGKNPPLRGICRVCRVGFQGGSCAD